MDINIKDYAEPPEGWRLSPTHEEIAEFHRQGVREVVVGATCTESAVARFLQHLVLRYRVEGWDVNFTGKAAPSTMVGPDGNANPQPIYLITALVSEKGPAIEEWQRNAAERERTKSDCQCARPETEDDK